MRFRRAGYQFRFEPAASIYHLGNTEAPEGGSRNWIHNKHIAGWHHCVGDWYFTFGHANGRKRGRDASREPASFRSQSL